jgi:glutamate carboxypeptidase
MQPHSNVQHILEARLAPGLDLLRRMVEINSHTLNREGIRQLAGVTAEAFAEFGFVPERIPSTNPAFGDHLILTLPGKGAAHVGLISHLDTVFTAEEEQRHNFRWQVEGTRIFGPGTEDVKGGTVMMWLVLAALKATEPEVFESTRWTLLFDASEEMHSADFGGLCVNRLGGAAAALVFEAGHCDGNTFPLVAARKGRAVFKISVEGRGAHAGNGHARGASAIAQLCHTIQKVEALTDPGRHLTFNVGTVSGGSAPNRIPHLAFARAEMRAYDADIYREGLTRIRALERDVQVCSAEDGFPCRVSIEIEAETPPWPGNAASDQLLKTFAEAGAELGVCVPREERAGLSDANYIWHAVPTLDGLGPSGDNAHCSERALDGSKEQEYVEPGSFVPKAALNVRALVRLLKTPL